MRPTGLLHLGHLHGVLKNWIKLQHEYLPGVIVPKSKRPADKNRQVIAGSLRIFNELKIFGYIDNYRRAIDIVKFFQKITLIKL